MEEYGAKPSLKIYGTSEQNVAVRPVDRDNTMCLVKSWTGVIRDVYSVSEVSNTLYRPGRQRTIRQAKAISNCSQVIRV